ncbi:hypothetical protein Rsub_06152 [Raphidocelis subcapitata]|uniref:Calcineurin-like phosphoesterase domain-containing protein n=1 Tax=Raphidocelis subcapitata TaxID=307507 RepID=A0A2V0P7J3_9CHLO|nr:hypothetical protein Rsub_06152 [Raphidocelis subcapitata]|eukprot:GBF93820.1 hypothetical protein Rsub_06152 [Raphidocelis subcapitata]
MASLWERVFGGRSGGGGKTGGAGAPQDAAAAAASSFCGREFPEMLCSFVDHVVDCAYTGAAPAGPSSVAEAPPLPLRLPAAERLVAIGDLHGDMAKARRAFRLAGLTDDAGNWAGGSTVAVQVGDILDRGDEELPLLYFLERLQEQAAAAGGALHVLNGNHETMNVAGNFRYATAGADAEMAAWATWRLLGDKLRRECGCSSIFGDAGSAAAAASAVAAAHEHGAPPAPGGRAAQFNPLRRAALRPGGPVARRFFARHPTVLQVGSTLFVHGGVLPAHVEYGLGAINSETQAWLMGEGGDGGRGAGGAGGSQGGSSGSASGKGSGSASSKGRTDSSGSGGGSGSGSSKGGNSSAAAAAPLQQQQQQQEQQPTVPAAPPAPGFLRGAHAVVWARDYSQRDEARCDCEKLTQVLDALPGAKRMVVGHTIQTDGITAACAGRVLRVDVGMSRGCGDGEPEVLEILGDAVVRRLTEAGAPELLGAAGQLHQPHHLSGPAVDTPAARPWAEALQRWYDAVGGAVGGGGRGGGAGGDSAAGGAAGSGEQAPDRRPQPTPS